MALTTWNSNGSYIGQGLGGSQQYGGVAVASDYHWYYNNSNIRRAKNSSPLTQDGAVSGMTGGYRFPITCAGPDERVFFGQPDGVYEVINARGTMSIQKVYSISFFTTATGFNSNATRFIGGDDKYIYLVDKAANNFMRLRVSDMVIVDTITCSGIGVSSTYQETGTVAVDGKYIYVSSTYNNTNTTNTFQVIDKVTGATVNDSYVHQFGYTSQGMLNQMAFSIKQAPEKPGTRFAINTSGNQTWGTFYVNDVNPTTSAPDVKSYGSATYTNNNTIAIASLNGIKGDTLLLMIPVGSGASDAPLSKLVDAGFRLIGSSTDSFTVIAYKKLTVNTSTFICDVGTIPDLRGSVNYALVENATLIQKNISTKGNNYSGALITPEQSSGLVIYQYQWATSVNVGSDFTIMRNDSIVWGYITQLNNTSRSVSMSGTDSARQIKGIYLISDSISDGYVPPSQYGLSNLPSRLKVGDSIKFNFTGSPQTLNFRPEVKKYRIELYGAEGGLSYVSGGIGGRGGYVYGDLIVPYNKNLHVYIGGQGAPGNNSGASLKAGGWNGGGNSYYGGAGGGATDVRTILDNNPLNMVSLQSRLIVAGAGAGGEQNTGPIGDGGGWTGGIGQGSGNATGGTQTAGGAKGGYSPTNSTDGSFGAGGSVINSYGDGSGGGSGWYGGGGDAGYNAAGGSSYVAGNVNCPTPHPEGLTLTNSGTNAGINKGNGYAIFTVLELTATPPSKSFLISQSFDAKTVGDEIDVSWESVPVPSQPPGINLDIPKVFYQLELSTNGLDWFVINTGIEGTSKKIRLIAGGNSINTRIRLIPYVLYSGMKFFSQSYDTSYSFTMLPVPPDTKLPNAVIFDGKIDYLNINNRVIPTTGDFTIEFSFRHVQNISSTKYLMDFRSTTMNLSVFMTTAGKVVLQTPGNSVTTTSAYNDNRIHFVAIRRQGNTFSLMVDGTTVNFTASSTLDFSTITSAMIGYNYTLPNSYAEGMIGLPRFWNDVRTDQELNTYKSTVVPNNEQGLIDYIICDPLTGKIKPKINSWTITMGSSLLWSYLFIAILDINIPYPNDFQKKDNIDYIRTMVNKFRLDNGLTEKQWTDIIIVPGYTPIKATHWNEIETGILEVYQTIGEKINIPEVEDQLKETIQPGDRRFPLNNLPQRINNIARGLKNK